MLDDYITNIGDGNISSGDPYSNAGARDQIMKDIESIMEALKGGKDCSAEVNHVMDEMQNFGSNVVGQDSESQTQLTKYLSGVANVQSLINSQPVQSVLPPVKDVDQYTGKQKDGTSVSPVVALTHQLEYLVNSPQTKYLVDADKNGKIHYTTTPPTANPSYSFFQNHPDLYDSMKSNISNFLKSFKNPPPGSGSPDLSDTPAPGYSPNSTGTSIMNFPVGQPPTNANAIEYMWDQANQPDVPATGQKPDPAILNQVTSAMGSINQSYTSASSAVQTVGQTDIQTFNAEQGNLNKFEQAMMAFIKALVQGQKTQ